MGYRIARNFSRCELHSSWLEPEEAASVLNSGLESGFRVLGFRV